MLKGKTYNYAGNKVTFVSNPYFDSPGYLIEELWDADLAKFALSFAITQGVVFKVSVYMNGAIQTYIRGYLDDKMLPELSQYDKVIESIIDPIVEDILYSWDKKKWGEGALIRIRIFVQNSQIYYHARVKIGKDRGKTIIKKGRLNQHLIKI